MIRENIRNIAIIAHVDHGKTTLVDGLLKQSGVYRDNEKVVERVMDSNDLERERGITILAKNTAIEYNGVRINVVDTPGHADFGGEVERVLKMVDAVLLLVDAFEGTMPQTRFVLGKALELGLKCIVVVNKIDRPDSRPLEVIDQVLDLFIELGVHDDRLEFPYVFVSSKEGYAVKELSEGKHDLKPLLDMILQEVPCPEGDPDAPYQLLISSIDHDSFVGRMGIGRIVRGSITANVSGVVCNALNNETRMVKIGRLYGYEGLKRVENSNASVGDIVCVAGLGDITIGDTVCAVDCIQPLPFVAIDEPTLSMNFSVNDSPFAGREGTFVTTRHLRDRLYGELEKNVSLRVEDTDSPDTIKVSGRGELHLTILIETMRREGYEFRVSKPTVITKEIDGVLMEPIERLTVSVPDEFSGAVIEKLGRRKAEMLNMVSNETGYTVLEFKVPARGIIGYRNEFLTDTKGNGIMNHSFDCYEEMKGDIQIRMHGTLIAWETGEAVAYGLYNAQERGQLFISPGTKVYEGMIVGATPGEEDITINVCKKKQLTNVRASGSDDALRLYPPLKMSLEQALEFIQEDELVEITPESIRLRKRELNTGKRLRIKSGTRKRD